MDGTRIETREEYRNRMGEEISMRRLPKRTVEALVEDALMRGRTAFAMRRFDEAKAEYEFATGLTGHLHEWENLDAVEAGRSAE